MRRILFTILLLFALGSQTGQGQEDDTTQVTPAEDTLLTTMKDTLQPPTRADSILYIGPDNDTIFLGDSLTEEQRAMLEFQERREQYQERVVERKPNLSFFDSLTTYFTSGRIDARTQVEQSFFHDAGDYFRFSPSFIVTDHQSTPMRKTVQPFGLSGNRLNIISNETVLHPFEHIIEPDGLIDLNDIPIAADHSRYIIPGPAGLLFGGDQAVASLVTSPKHPDSKTPESAFMVDQGTFEYNYVRGRYSKRFEVAREIDMMVAYRNADGFETFRDDDAYHYAGRLFQPLGAAYGFTASGQLYSREGHLVIRPDRTGVAIARDRADRNAELSLDRHNSDHTARYRIGYRYLRQGSHLDGVYKGRFDKNGWGLFTSREWIGGSSVYRVELRSDHLDYTDGSSDHVRDRGEVTVTMVRLTSGLRYALTAGAHYIDGFDLLPSAALVVTTGSRGLYLLLSAGYAERAPSLYELHLDFQRAAVYENVLGSYADQGNPGLEKEKQMVASGLIELGSVDTNIRLSLTGGTILDAIDWQDRVAIDTGGSAFKLFSPGNTDIDFIDISLQQKLKLADFLRLRSGGSFHRVVYELIANKPYSPEYQLFSGLELHYFWPQKIMDLYAYGEVIYTSEYDGYEKTGLGRQAIANMKLSFGIKGFRFHYVIQNVFSVEYEPREYMINPGRYSYFGLVWNFLD
ncbi:MAG: hypothetical protein JSU74_12410 [Candidatus Zixiibacteriota bacterium]|nr:MAG: hypothetical protein JSU74_12410 [candidate division Zixibacteria bacterium]